MQRIIETAQMAQTRLKPSQCMVRYGYMLRMLLSTFDESFDSHNRY
jgi:hypothetical protein